MNKYKVITIATIAAFLGTFTFYFIQTINADSSFRTTNSDGRIIQVWLAEVECEKENNCTKCIQELTESKKIERLKEVCPSRALQWKYY